MPAAVAARLADRPEKDLSPREREILSLIGAGLTNKQIAYTLSIAEHTAKNHVSHILSKLGVEDRAQAVTLALQRGLVHLPD